MILRLQHSQWAPFAESLCGRRDVETAGIILAERLHQDAVLLGRHFFVVPDAGYQIRRIDQLRIDPIVLNRLIRPAREGNMSIITVHTHPSTDRPWFSIADDLGDSRLMPSFLAQTPGPHGSLVIAGDTRAPTARMWTNDGELHAADIRIVGRTIDCVPATNLVDEDAEWFARQRLALGEHGQSVLRRLHVGVVGLGGTGSVVFAQLVHLGVGRITIADGDRVDASNVSRVLGATSGDADVTWKVDVAARYANQLGLDTRVDIIRAHLGAGASHEELENCDVIFSCVDKHAPRALLNRHAYAKASPVIDMGSAFRVDVGGRVVAGAGRVVIVGPGRQCLACWGHIDPHRLRIESLPANDRVAQAAEGYVEGADVHQPSVIAFNTMIAGSAVVEFLRLVTKFAGADDPPARLAFDFEAGTVRRNGLAAIGGCRICGVGIPNDTTLEQSRFSFLVT